ncbi:MAG: HGxxPAAW family protein [Dermatophilaceae bacterium]
MAYHESHGHSVAAWTAVSILMVASCVMAAAVVWPNTGLFIAGAVLALVGVIAGKVLAMAGFGVRKSTDGSHESAPGRSQVDSGIN